MLTAAALAAGLVGCTPPASDGGEVVVTDDDRIREVRAAREALAGPVPEVVAEAERLVEALEQVWTEPGQVEGRAERAAALQLTPFGDAVEALDAVELDGVGPDVVAARDLVAAMVADGRALLDVAEEELASLTALPTFDDELETVLAGWDQRGSHSQQLEAFERLTEDATALADQAAGRTATPACTGLWERRAEAARTVAERTEELRGLIRDRRGQEFDELRDTFRQDPYDLGGLLGDLDAEAARSCWAEGSDAPDAVELLRTRTDELEVALDPSELRG